MEDLALISLIRMTVQASGDGAADTIYYIDLKDTGDTINNFVSGEDKINLSAIDSGDVDHAFNWGGQQTGQYVQAHSVTWFQSGSDVVVLADTDGNLTTAEFSMTLTWYLESEPERFPSLGDGKGASVSTDSNNEMRITHDGRRRGLDRFGFPPLNRDPSRERTGSGPFGPLFEH